MAKCKGIFKQRIFKENQHIRSNPLQHENNDNMSPNACETLPSESKRKKRCVNIEVENSAK